MTEVLADIQIPNRALFKASEVCELVKLQPYVLRSWEAEFPRLGVAKTNGGARVYRRADVEQVLRIKHMLLVEGLTLAGARRRIEEESMPPAEEGGLDELFGQDARERLTAVKRGLRGILELLSGRGSHEFRLVMPTVASAQRSAPATARVKIATQKRSSGGAASRRKRHA